MASSTSSTTETTSADPRREYHDPFFDLASLSLPSNIKSLFRYARYYFYAEPIVGAVVRKMAQYPVTDIIVQHPDKNSAAEEKWRDVIKKLKLKSFLIEMGLDYFTYGNCFFSPYLPIIRRLICPHCKEMDRSDEVTEIKIGNVENIKFKNGQFEGKCPKCDENAQFEVIEKPERNIEDINFIRWNPLNITIDQNPITGETSYYYELPNEVENKILLGDESYLETVPMEFIEAAHDNKSVKLSSNMLYHMKRETIAQTNAAWGRPLMYNVLKYLYYLQTLRKAQEVVAVERSVPFRYLFPGSSQPGANPIQNYDAGKWRRKMQGEIEDWKNDPAYISLMPFPVQEGNLGGDAKALLLTPEINNVIQNAITGMGVPQEFIYGGMQWTGSSVSLRMVENKMLNFRTDLELILDFIQDILQDFLDLPEVNLELQDFKMADDIQRKQLAIKLNQANKISDATLLNELGYDPDQEREKMMKEVKEREIMMQKKALASARIQGIMAKIKGKYKIETMREMKEEQQEMMQEMQIAQGGQSGRTPQQIAKEVGKIMQQKKKKSGNNNQVGQQMHGQLDDLMGDGGDMERQQIMEQILGQEEGRGNAKQQ